MNLIEYLIPYQELLGFIAATLSTVSFLPQLVKVWKLRSAKDISYAMYVIYGTSLLLWTIYGIIIHSTPLIIAEVLTLILVIAILIMKYRWE